MAKPKAKTIQQYFGFHDGDLTTPKHDEIMIWLDDNAEDVVKLFTNYYQEKIDRSFEKTGDEINRLKESDTWSYKYDLGPILPVKFSVEDINCVWEFSVTEKINYRKYIVGFVDLRINFSYQSYWCRSLWRDEPHCTQRTGYVRQTYKSTGIINFEVKTKIPSLGELFRQINMYKLHERRPFAVVSPDARFKDKIESQGMWFVHYPYDLR